MAGEISSLRATLQRLLHDLGLEGRWKSEQMGVVWPRVVGPAVARIAHPAQLRSGTLFVDVVDHVWMQELKLQERELIERLNDALGEPLVRRLFLRLGRITAMPLPQPPQGPPTPGTATRLSPEGEAVLEDEVASVRDPELREVLKRFRRQMMHTRPQS